jgi:hypothetical protein
MASNEEENKNPKDWSKQATIRDYLRDRLEDQKGWYSRKADKNKKWFMRYQTIVIVLGALIPVIIVILEVLDLSNLQGVFSAFISGVITIVAGIDKLENPQTNWYNYRANEEKLKKEGHLYEFRVGSYRDLDDDEAERMLVENVENIVSSDVVRFVQHQQRKKEKSKEKIEEKESAVVVDKDKDENR